MKHALSRIDLQDFRTTLLSERARLISGRPSELEIVSATASAVEDQGPLPHDQFVALRKSQLDGRKLKLIDAALARIDRGEFGVCQECDGRIPPKRLLVIPWAAYGVPCQEQLDTAGEAPELLLTA